MELKQSKSRGFCVVANIQFILGVLLMFYLAFSDPQWAGSRLLSLLTLICMATTATLLVQAPNVLTFQRAGDVLTTGKIYEVSDAIFLPLDHIFPGGLKTGWNQWEYLACVQECWPSIGTYQLLAFQERPPGRFKLIRDDGKLCCSSVTEEELRDIRQTNVQLTAKLGL